MKLKTLIQNAQRLEVAEVEIEFIPGIPQIHFLGLPDRIIKESFYRIKSALKSSGYKFPLTSQMIVNIKPNHLRKSSRGLELAVALGILIKTNQIESDLIKPEWVLYGELGLDGNVYEPSDLQQNIFSLKDIPVLTGRGEGSIGFRLQHLESMEIVYSEKIKKFIRPEVGLHRLYTESEAEFLFLAAVSGLHALLAGDSGAGKSTLAHSLVSFLPEPSGDEKMREHKHWRPLVNPHASITSGAFLGGGGNLYEGEIERVQGGVLLLDELLEFAPEILESLRGPMTGDVLRLSRGAFHREIQSNFQVVATTNLCRCGKWTPEKKSVSCRFSRVKCTSYLERFSGPILDRFGLLLFTSSPQDRRVTGWKILERIEKWKLKPETPGTVPGLLQSYYRHLSTRRLNYLQRVADIYARERGAAQGSSFAEDYSRAEQWVIRPFEQLEKGMG